MTELYIALRYLRGTGFAKVVTWFSFIGIALGVATLVIVTSVMNGFRAELLDKIVGMNGHIEVAPYGDTGINNYDSLKLKLLKAKNIKVAIAQIEKQAILINKGSGRGVIINGISKDDLQKKTLISANIKDGKINEFTGNSVFVGKRLSETMALKVGDIVRCLIPDGLITAFGNLPKEENFKISGIFEVGMNEYDKNVILMPLKTAQEFFSMPAKISKFEIFVRNIKNLKQTTDDLVRILPKNMNVLDWQHADAGIFHAVIVEKNVMTLILSIIILVAAFNIISGLTMLTSNKIRDIAILRTMGMCKASVFKIFLYIGSIIGVFGTALGLSLGLAVSMNIEKIKNFLERFSDKELFSEEIYFLSQLPSKTDIIEVCLITAFSILMCFLATIYPARKASKLNPIDALRF